MQPTDSVVGGHMQLAEFSRWLADALGLVMRRLTLTSHIAAVFVLFWAVVSSVRVAATATLINVLRL